MLQKRFFSSVLLFHFPVTKISQKLQIFIHGDRLYDDDVTKTATMLTTSATTLTTTTTATVTATATARSSFHLLCALTAKFTTHTTKLEKWNTSHSLVRMRRPRPRRGPWEREAGKA